MVDYVTERTTPGDGQRREVAKKRRVGIAALLALATGSTLIGWPDLAGALGPGGEGLTPTVEANVAVGGRSR